MNAFQRAEKIQDIAKELTEDLIRFRREIHKHPELGFEEFRTTDKIKQALQEIEGLEFQKLSKTGVVGILRGNSAGKTVLLRADIDALPVIEKTELSFSSEEEGKMHACGHDAHTAILLGAVQILSRLREDLQGTVKFVFQPGEEAPNGSRSLVEAGVMENPRVDAVFGTHVWPDIPSGQYGIRDGGVMAAPDFFHVRVLGKGGHGSQPEKCKDPILVGHEIYEGFQNVATHRIGVLNPVVISVTRFSAGNSNAIFPDDCILEGTVRSYDENIRTEMPKILEKIVRLSAEKYDVDYEFRYRGNCPAVVNAPELADVARKSIRELFGEEAIVATPQPAMTGDDFSVYLDYAPGVYFWTGTRTEEEIGSYPLHHCKFTVDESILSRTAAVMAHMALSYLEVVK